MKKSFFIAGTGTDVGKTLITCALAHQHTRGGYAVAALKPVVSGFSGDDANSDPALLLRSLGRAATPENIAAIAPWRYREPVSPHLAGETPRAEDVADFCARACVNADIALAEGAGGLMTPLNADETMLDVAQKLGWPLILVAGAYLGSLSHTLTAMRACRPHAVIISESKQCALALAEAAQTLRQFADKSTSIYTVPRLRAQPELWKHLPPLTEI